jgi:protein involved in polysaccharide export with SLBB domain
VKDKLKENKVKLAAKHVIIATVLAITAMLFACATEPVVQKAVPVEQAPATNKPARYVILPGDELDIKFFFNPELNETITVRPDGMISLQLLDEIKAEGLTPTELDMALTDLYAKELRKPVITVIVRSFAGQRVYVGGEVNTQGLLELRPGLTPLQAVFQARGFKETAQPAETIIIRKGEDNRPIPLRMDLNAAMYGNGEGADFYLQPDDVVYVPKSAIARANKFVNQYIQQLFLFRGVSLGFSYEVYSAE